MKSVVLLLVVMQLSSTAYGNGGCGSSNRFNRPREPFTYAPNTQMALQQAQVEGKPILVFVHRTDSLSCAKLFNDLLKSEGIRQLSDNFVVLQSRDGSNKQLENLGTDTYIPRILFFDRNGEEIEGISNKNQPTYPYYYGTADDVLMSMIEVLNRGQY